MESPDPHSEREIFAAAAALPPEERAAYLDAACDARSEVRARVEAWLGAHAASEFMQTVVEENRLSPEGVGERIGNYKLLEKIGEGGFGVVWVADQERPVRRRVALKIIKLGMDTKEVIARFGQERQALAMMDHPHIAKVFDAGATEWGRPYFVMELVRGIKITDYCDQANLSTAERLALFVQVCSAVQHAHQKGIVHRDLKPSNILVTLHDGVPVPKVIDFGVAKATQQERLTDQTIYTQFQQMIGTPLYMSPEQAEMSGLDIDTRSDIYSLGVLLYELLTGRTPFDPEDLMRQGLDEIRRAIREREPLTPSLFLRTLPDATRSTIAQHRQSDPVKLTKLVRGDLDWIVMKALEKDRTRRYDTANGLGMDIQRHLANEPVLARPPTAFYRLRRLVRRNRLAFVAGGMVVLALLAGLAVATVSLVNERRARAGEVEQRAIAENERAQAQASARDAISNELTARRLLYAADINLVQQSLLTNDVGRARQLLDRHRPESGEPDLRGWEWRYLWQQCRSGAMACLAKREGGGVKQLSFSADGTLLLAGYGDGRIEIWDVAKRQLSKVVQESSATAAYAVFSPRADAFAATLETGAVHLYDVAAGTAVPLCKVDGWVADLSYSQDGELLAVLTYDPAMLQVLRVADRSVLMNIPVPEGGGGFWNNVRFSPDKQNVFVACGAWNGPTLRCLRVPGAEVVWETGIGQVAGTDRESDTDIGFTAMDLSPDGHTLVTATGYRDPQIRVVDATNGQLVRRLKGHTGWVAQLAFSKDGRVLASASTDQTIRRWDTATWENVSDPLHGHEWGVNTVAFSADGRLLASGGRGDVLLWDNLAARSAAGTGFLPQHIQTAVMLTGGRQALGRTVDLKFSVVDLSTMTEELVPDRESAPPRQPSQSVPQPPRRPAILDATRLGLDGFLSMSAVSPDGKLLAVASEAGTAGLYDASTLSKLAILRGNRGSVHGLAFSPDSSRLVLTSGGDYGAVIWDVSTRQELLRLSSQSTMLAAVEFSDDGNTLLVGSLGIGRDRSGTCQFWRVPSWAEIEEIERNGRWPHHAGHLPGPPAPPSGDLRDLPELMHRKRLDDPRPLLAYEIRRQREESLGIVARSLRSQNRLIEAEPLLREILENRRLYFTNPHEVLSASSKLAGLLVSLAASEPAGGDAAKRKSYSREAEDLIAEQIDLLAKMNGDHRQRTIWDGDAVLSGIIRIIDALHSLAEIGRAAGDATDAADLEGQARDFLAEQLGQLGHLYSRIPQDPWETLNLAALEKWCGRDGEYEMITRSLLERTQIEPGNADFAAAAAHALCLVPSPDSANLIQALYLARCAVDLSSSQRQRAQSQLALGLVLFREGDAASAERELGIANQSVDLADGNADWKSALHGQAQLFQSMILFRRGNDVEARGRLAEAEKLVGDMPRDERTLFRALAGAPMHDLPVWLACKETRALLHPDE